MPPIGVDVETCCNCSGTGRNPENQFRNCPYCQGFGTVEKADLFTPEDGVRP